MTLLSFRITVQKCFFFFTMLFTYNYGRDFGVLLSADIHNWSSADYIPFFDLSISKYQHDQLVKIS